VVVVVVDRRKGAMNRTRGGGRVYIHRGIDRRRGGLGAGVIDAHSLLSRQSEDALMCTPRLKLIIIE
jgi:hypothetical protein